jgi:hypothetical protein
MNRVSCKMNCLKQKEKDPSGHETVALKLRDNKATEVRRWVRVSIPQRQEGGNI